MAVNETVERIVYEGVDKITAVSEKSAAGVKLLRDQLDAAKGQLAGLGAFVSAGAMVALYKDTLHATAGLHDMAEATGASVEGLSAIQRVAKIGGQDFEGLGQQIGRMIKGLRESSDEGGRTARALDAINVNARAAGGQFRDTSEILVDVAKKLAQYRDDGNKVALVQDILGKGAERYLPLLKEIAEGTDLHATVTAKQAEELDRAEKEIRRVTLALEDNRRELVLRYAPALVDNAQQLTEGIRLFGGFWNAIYNVGFAIDPFKDVGSNLKEIREELEMIERIKNYPMASRGYAVGPDEGTLRKRQQFLQLVQRQESMRLATPDSLDARDLRANPAIKPSASAPAASTASITAEQIAKQWEEAREEELKVQSEAANLTDQFRRTEREQMRKYRALDLQETDDYYQAGGGMLIKNSEERIAILIARADQEEELAIAEGERIVAADGQSHSLRLEALRLLFEEETALETNAYEERLVQIQAFSDEELAVYGGRYALLEGMQAQHQAKMLSIENTKHQAQRGMEMTTFSLVAGLLQELPGKSKAAAIAVIAINKGLAIAQTVQSTAAATMRAFADLGPIAGAGAAAYIQGLGAVQIGLIAASGLVEASQVGKGATPQGTFAASPSTGLPVSPSPASSTASEPMARQATIVNFPAGRKIFTLDDMQDLFDLLNESARNGNRLDQIIMRQS